jgi:hypothetical protein
MNEWCAGCAADLPDNLPPNEYYEYYGPDYKLHIPTDPSKTNKNQRGYLDGVSL